VREECSSLAKILASEMVLRDVVLERLNQLIHFAMRNERALIEDIATE
jgi:hypothetical protein